MRILVVDDDAAIVEMLRRSLTFEGYTVDTATDGEEAIACANQFHPDMALLDWILPRMNGIEVCRRLRETSDIPIILLTARGAVGDIVVGLDSGADDYLVKPFSLDELMARVRAVMRRRGMFEADQALTFGKLRLDPGAHEVSFDSTPLDLSGKEFNILELLMRNPRQVITRDMFYDRIWGYNFEGESNMLEVYISYLRNKLDKVGASGLLQTVRGAGYVLRD